MSFFSDFLESVAIDDVSDKMVCNIVFGSAIKVNCNFKLEQMNEDEIVLKCKKDRFKIIGTGLKIITIAKGEIEVIGNICGVQKIWWV